MRAPVRSGRAILGRSHRSLPMMSSIRRGLAPLAFLVLAQTLAGQARPYEPSRDGWERRSPGKVGIDSAALAAAVTFAEGADNGWPTDLREQLKVTTAREPYPAILGPVKDRARTNGIIIKNG